LGWFRPYYGRLLVASPSKSWLLTSSLQTDAVDSQPCNLLRRIVSLAGEPGGHILEGIAWIISELLVSVIGRGAHLKVRCNHPLRHIKRSKRMTQVFELRLQHR
jgi:hypothetical protein